MTLVKRSILKIIIPIIVICLIAILLIRKITNNNTMKQTSELLTHKIKNYSEEVNKQFFKMGNVAQAFSNIFYDGVNYDEETILKFFVNFKNKYPACSDFYGVVNEKYYDGTLWVPDPTWEPKKRAWYINAEKARGTVAFSDVFVDVISGKNIVSISQSIIDKTGTMVGVVAIDYMLSDVDKTVQSLREGDERIFVLTKEGHFAVSNDYTGDDNFKTVENGRYADIATSIMAGTSELIPANIRGINYLLNSIAIGDTGWTLVIGEKSSKIYNFVNTLSMFLTISLFVLCVFVVVFVVISILHIAQGLNTVATTMDTIVSGKADLTRRIKLDMNYDELKLIQDSFNTFVERLQNLVMDLKAAENTLSNVCVGISDNVSNAAQSIKEITGDIESVGDEINSQMNDVTNASSVVNDVTSSADELSTMIDAQSGSVENASSAVEEMVGNIQSINTFVEKMVSSFGELDSSAKTGIRTQIAANDMVKEILSQSQGLQVANETLTSIADETNLLAMNAAIESAHAGEAGKGFSVVADEIRKLSETSQEQSKSISVNLNKIHALIDKMVELSQDSTAAFTNVSDKISETNIIVDEIKTAINEQDEGGKQIVSSLSVMKENTSGVKTSGGKMIEGNRYIISEIKKLQNTAESMKRSMTKLSKNSSTVLSASSQLESAANDVRTASRGIANNVAQFNV